MWDLVFFHFKENKFNLSQLLDSKSAKIKTVCEDSLYVWLFRAEETHSIIWWCWAYMLKYQSTLSQPVYSIVICWQAVLSHLSSVGVLFCLAPLFYRFSVYPLIWKCVSTLLHSVIHTTPKPLSQVWKLIRT